MHIGLASVYHFSCLKGGNERYAHHLALGLVAQGHQVIYYTSRQLPVIEFLGKPLPSPAWFHPPKTTPLDIFHACGSGLPLLAIASYFHPHIPTFLTFQAPSNPNSPLLRIGSKFEQANYPRFFDGIITTSPQNQRLLHTQWPNVPTTFIPLMVPPIFLQSTLLPSPPLTPRLLFIARLDAHHYYKGLSIALHALSLLPSPYHLNIIGDGPLKPTYLRQAYDLGLKSRVHFLGALSDTQLIHYLLTSTCLLFPSTSDSEGFGLALVEAMALGLPTITTTAIGIASWLAPKRVTTIIPPHDPQALAQAIQTIVNQPQPEQIHRAQRFAHTLTLEAMVSSTITFYHQLQSSK